MAGQDCRDKVRFSLSDKSGALRFERFDIVDQPECRRTLDDLRAILLGRPLLEIDLAEIKRISCPHGDHCMRAVSEIIEECQTMFARGKHWSPTYD
jgi:hypothetical protein